MKPIANLFIKSKLKTIPSYKKSRQFEEHEAAIYGAAFTPDGQYVVTGCVNGYLKLWECNGETATASIANQEAHELGVATCDFSPKGKPYL
jgi:WD40 repeat protein